MRRILECQKLHKRGVKTPHWSLQETMQATVGGCHNFGTSNSEAHVNILGMTATLIFET